MPARGSFSLTEENIRRDNSTSELELAEYKQKRTSAFTGLDNGKVSPIDVSKTEKGAANEEEAKPDAVDFLKVFRFASGKDRLLMCVGTIMASIHGAALPVLMVIFGEMSDVFIFRAQFDMLIDVLYHNLTILFPNQNISREDLVEMSDEILEKLRELNLTNDYIDRIFDYANVDLMQETSWFAIYYSAVGGLVLIVGYLQVVCWKKAAYSQCLRIRTMVLKSVLKQHIGWFDVHESGELSNRLSADVNVLEEGIGDVLSIGIQFAAAFPAGMIIGLVYNWQTALFILGCSPLLGGITMFVGKASTALTNEELTAYAKAGAVAQEVLTAIRTVVAFGGQDKETNRYTANLDDALAVGKKKGWVIGSGLGMTYGIIFVLYGTGFLLATHLMLEDPSSITPGDMMISFFAMIQGLFSIGFAAPKFQEFSKSRGAAYVLYSLVDLTSEIDSSSEEGKRLENVKGNLEFKNVTFAYPSRSEVKILKDISLDISCGQTVALVGMSGSGKSTTVQLIQRFYDPQHGQVLLDGFDIREFNIGWLRRQMGVVSQEPVLFGTTIGDNIRYGKVNASHDEVIRAAKEAGAHDFIQELPEKYNTLVGERGAQLSGGQKQRIAIARALVRDPRILLLDEATSALDSHNETIVQEALDKARRGRTTLVVAHRLSTIRSADTIVGFEEGCVVERGTHDELMRVPGVYHTLVINQSKKSKGDKEDEEDDDSFQGVEEATQAVHTLACGKILAQQLSKDGTVISDNNDLSEQEELPEVEFRRIMRVNSPEWPWILLGCFCAIVAGVTNPVSAVIFAELLASFVGLSSEEVWDSVVRVSIAFIILALVSGIVVFGQNACFYRSGEYLTRRLRLLAFKAYMKQDIAYFDDPINGTGALCSRLATDAPAIQGATGFRLGSMFMSVSSMGGGIILGFIYSWELTLLILAFVPGLLAAGFVQMRMATGLHGKSKEAVDQASKVSMEAISNIRTIATLTREAGTCSDYGNIMEPLYREKTSKTHGQGFGYGLSQAIIFFSMAAGFYLGGYLVQEQGLPFDKMMLVFSAIAFGSMAAGEMNSFAPSYGSAKTSAARLFNLLDRVPLINTLSDEGVNKDDFKGAVELDDVHFNYPTRPDVPVLKRMNLKVAPGQMVALVGSSGCGKSTVVQMLERFYDPKRGSVSVDGVDIRTLNLQRLRREIGIVSQEPILFDCSIRDNIAYGDNTRKVEMSEIIEAARQANIHNFIESLPLGYETNVGDKGAQLSGGQKQRVAIARALIRNPRILILDEATSALDTESEKVVQEALDKAQEGRTSLVIAHRLSTVQNADLIAVVHHGHVTETGTHSQLLAKQGIYSKLVKAQTKSN